MKVSTAALSAAALLAASVSSVPVRRDVPVNLVPQFGIQAGVNPTGTGNCDGVPNAQGVPIEIPCDCPPDRTSFIQELNSNVAAGHVLNNPSVQLSFPTDNSTASQLARLNAAAVTLQNLNGPGQGCPVAATTFSLQQAAINAGQNPNTVVVSQAAATAAATTAPAAATTVAPAAAAPAAASASPVNSSASSGALSQAQVAALAPSLGFQSGVNPTGTGNCDGAILGSNGQPIAIPCACPPSQDEYIQQLTANVNAGFAINNPTVKVSFPTDSSTASLNARLNAAADTLQNLNGPGQGCPVVSTTFPLQQDAINAGQNPATVVAQVAFTPSTSAAPAATSAAAPVTTPAPVNNAAVSGAISQSQIAALAPPLGFQSGVNPTGTGNCDGAILGSNGQPIAIPCACPPSQDEYIQQLTANVNAGFAINNPTVKVSFPTDSSTASQSARLNAASITLQNLNGPGQGCPVVSTTFPLQQDAINAGQNPATVVAQVPVPTSAAAPATSAAPAPVTTPAAAPAPASAAASSGALSQAQVSALAPPLGFQSGVNPTGTGNCDGAVDGANGQPIAVPCSCPPAQDEYIQQLTANVNAGHAINNPSVQVSFPTGSSDAEQAARIEAALVTIQNLNGPGVGCPAASTTLSSQLAAVQG